MVASRLVLQQMFVVQPQLLMQTAFLAPLLAGLATFFANTSCHTDYYDFCRKQYVGETSITIVSPSRLKKLKNI